MADLNAVRMTDGLGVWGEAIGPRVSNLGFHVLRCGLALGIGWIRIMKFTAHETSAIQPLLARRPFMGWRYHFFSARRFSDGLGIETKKYEGKK